MKRAVSISIGSSTRNKAVELELLGEKVSIERIGTDGDMEKAAQLYKELDGKVDAFGVGGADLGLQVAEKWYPLYSVRPMVRFVQKTPLVDGAGLKNTLENKLAFFIDEKIGDYVKQRGKKVLVVSGADRWGMSKSFLDCGYECVFGDLMFGLGMPFPIHTEKALKRLAAILLPVVGRIPFKWLYPTGEKQEKCEPKWENYYEWGTVIAGDCLYIKRHMPDADGRQSHRHQHDHRGGRGNVQKGRHPLSGHQHPGVGWPFFRHEYDGGGPGGCLWQEPQADPPGVR